MSIQADIVIEIAELFKTLVGQTRAQLNYYHASVYKDDTARNINHKVEKMRTIARLVNDEVISEAFFDHDAIKEKGLIIPGECSFASRTAELVSTIANRSEKLIEAANKRMLSVNPKEFKKHRRELMSVCPQGSRQWVFFQRL